LIRKENFYSGGENEVSDEKFSSSEKIFLSDLHNDHRHVIVLLCIADAKHPSDNFFFTSHTAHQDFFLTVFVGVHTSSGTQPIH